jgi:hypothetical protein
VSLSAPVPATFAQSLVLEDFPQGCEISKPQMEMGRKQFDSAINYGNKIKVYSYRHTKAMSTPAPGPAAPHP